MSKSLAVLVWGMLAVSGAASAHPSYEEAMTLIEDYRYAAALPALREAAQASHQGAQRTLAFMLLAGEAEYGPGVSADHAEAIRWFRHAAASGCEVSAQMLGRLAGAGVAPVASRRD